MINKKIYFFAVCIITILLTQSVIAEEKPFDSSRIISNPVNLNYQFQPASPSRREAADPTIEYYKGKYYLFASKSGGYWSSPDLIEWTYIPCKTITRLEDYAPAIMVFNNTLYFITSNAPRIFCTTNPDIDDWTEIDSKFEYGMGDPSIFSDEETGRVYMYWGCSDIGPITGVEIDPSNGFKSIGKPVDLILHNESKYGWEVFGPNNDQNLPGWNEGPAVIKVNGLYYLQYATNATQFDTYADACYVSTSPLGPFTCTKSNPYSIKPRGFVNGAGHGHTFKDKYGNYWHAATMTISVRHTYERRLGLFPTYFDEDGYMHSRTVFTDYPFIVPDKKVDFSKDDLSTGLNLLSKDKKVTASTSKSGFEPAKAADEYVKTWWAAASGNIGEWLQMDLGNSLRINAVQVAFGDEGFNALRNYATAPIYRYTVSYSSDGNDWLPLIDRSQNTKDQLYEMIMLDNPVYARYIKVENKGKFNVGNFSIADLRIFGAAEKELPGDVTNFEATRNTNDYRRASFKWDALPEVGTGYVLRWGTDPNRIDNAVVIYDDNAEFGFFNRYESYYFTIQAFNESGKGKISEPVFCPGQSFVPSFAHFDFTQKAKSITSSLPEGTDLSALTDKNPETSIDVPFSADTWFMFEMPASFIPTGYVIIVKDIDGKNNPMSWKLQSSRNGNPESRWADIDTKTNQTFVNADFNVIKVSTSASMYFRLLIQANNGGDNLHIAGVQIFGHFSSPETSLTGTITAEFPGVNSGGWVETIDKAVDRSFSTKYCADGHATGWIQYELPAAAKVDRYAITPSDGSGRNIKSWELSGSTDGNSWETLDTQNNQVFYTIYSTTEYTIKNPKEYKLYRLKITQNNGDTRYFELAEWQLFASTPASIENTTINAAISIYPNPVKDEFSISCEQQPESVEILNVEGQIIKSFTKKETNLYNVSDIPTGIYFVRIKTDEYHIVKFVK